MRGPIYAERASPPAEDRSADFEAFWRSCGRTVTAVWDWQANVKEHEVWSDLVDRQQGRLRLIVVRLGEPYGIGAFDWFEVFTKLTDTVGAGPEN